jgi:hypothetical protein
MATYCTKNDAGLCGVCGIPYADDKYARECHPISFLLDQHSQSVSSNRQPSEPPTLPPAHGPGTELSKLLKRIGINPTPTCSCRAKAAEMDAWGCDECERPERIDEVVAVMRAEAEARGLPFLDVAGRMLVRRAISNARRNA